MERIKIDISEVAAIVIIVVVVTIASVLISIFGQ